MIKLVVHTGVFLAKSVALNFTDVNECTNGTSNCSENTVRDNRVESYRCKCKPEFTADGGTCNGKIEPNLRV